MGRAVGGAAASAEGDRGGTVEEGGDEEGLVRLLELLEPGTGVTRLCVRQLHALDSSKCIKK